MITRNTTIATTLLIAAGYTVTSYPDKLAPTNLIVMLGDRTVTTLPVKGGGVCAASVDYLLSEQRYAKEPGRG